MTVELTREDFPNDLGFQGYQRLSDAQRELIHGGWHGGSALSEKQMIEGVFWWLLACDPIILAFDKIPKETIQSLPSIKLNEKVLSERISKLEIVCRLFATKPDTVIQALKQVW